jgi:hypothetical protein
MKPIDWWFILALVIVYSIYYQLKVHPAAVIGIFAYSLTLTLSRPFKGLWSLAKWLFHKRQAAAQVIIPAREPEPTSIMDWPAYYKLRPGQVVFGLNSRGRPVILNLAEGHSLLAGITGGGKTVAIHNMLIQCYAMGERFWNNFEVYLLDLKGQPKDMLHRWRPLVDGFADISEPEQLISLLRLLSERTHQHTNKSILVFVDEVANLTKFASDKESGRILEKLATQFRTSGNLVLATQVTRFDVVDTIVRHNLGRRICFLVRELAHIRNAMASSSLKEKDIPKRKGAFLALDSGSSQLLRGQVPMPNLYDTRSGASDITTLIERSLMAQAEDDPRLRLFVSVAQGKKKLAQLPGIVKVAGELDWLQQKDIMFYYRNYHLAGAIKQGLGKNPKANYLTCDFEEAYSRVRRYIALGEWHEEPPKEEDE